MKKTNELRQQTQLRQRKLLLIGRSKKTVLRKYLTKESKSKQELELPM